MTDSQVDPAQTEAEPPPHCLDPRVVRLWQLAWLGRTAVAAAAVAVLGRWVDTPLTSALFAAVVVLGLVGALVWPPARYHAWSFQVRKDDLLIRRGVLSRATSVIPHARIQHVDTRQDLVERWLGLARVVIYTAGIRGAELILPGLPAGEVEELRDDLGRLSGRDNAV